jgi:Suppressor of fused protein (SUFU)
MEEQERSESGAPVYRHTEAQDAEPVGPELQPAFDAIEAHVERHIGPITGVFHELVSEYVRLDVLRIEATDERPWHTLVTAGMSAKPMTVPDGHEADRFAELVIALPPGWPLDDESWQDERHYWPVRLRKQLARLPHMFATHLGEGHTIPNGDPPEPYAPGTKLCCALIAPPLTAPSEFHVLDTPDGPIHFLAVILIYRDEMKLKLDRGFEALFEPFEAAQVSEIVEPDRPSAVRRRKRFGLF